MLPFPGPVVPLTPFLGGEVAPAALLQCTPFLGEAAFGICQEDGLFCTSLLVSKSNRRV